MSIRFGSACLNVTLGRQGGIKDRILEAVRVDPTLRVELQRSPHDTMERILGVVVPRFVRFDFIAEGPRHHALVLPWGAP